MKAFRAYANFFTTSSSLTARQPCQLASRPRRQLYLAAAPSGATPGGKRVRLYEQLEDKDNSLPGRLLHSRTLSHQAGHPRSHSRLQGPYMVPTPSTGGMTDFSRWTKEALMDRIRLLEEALAKQKESGTVASEPASLGVSTPKKVKKGIDPSKYTTRFIAIKLAYLGKRYGGFEYQPSGALPTVEEELWKALVKACLIFPTESMGAHEVNFDICDYSKCGRTDRGVSAFGQVIALRVRSNRRKKAVAEGEEAEEEDEQDIPADQEIQYGKVLNRLLPPDIRILAWCPSPPPGFSARFSCRERQYRYFFTQPAYFGAPTPGTQANGGAPADGWLDIKAMRAAAKHFVGVHDFRNFCKVDPNKQITNFVRRIFDADITEVPDIHSSLAYYADGDGHAQSAGPKVYSFDVRGSAFLWHQIRHMVGILFLVGQGRESPDTVAALLDPVANPARPSYAMAEEFPLVLWDCIFPPFGPEGMSDGSDNDSSFFDKKGTAQWSNEKQMAEDVPADAVWNTWSDSLEWYTVTEESPNSRMFVDGLWREWRAAKMDEILANRLLDQVTRGAVGSAGPVTPPVEKSHVYEGGDGPRRGGVYVPLLKRQRIMSPEDVNDRFAQQRGFANAAAMREIGNWRTVIKARKAEEAAAAAAAEAAEAAKTSP